MSQSGEVCTVSGLYKSECGGGYSIEIVVREGYVFPECEHCNYCCAWFLVKRTGEAEASPEQDSSAKN